MSTITPIKKKNKYKINMATHSAQDKLTDNSKQMKNNSQTSNEIKDDSDATQEPQAVISKTIPHEGSTENKLLFEEKGTEDGLQEFNEILEEVSKNVTELPLLDDIDDIINHLTEGEGVINELVQLNVDFEDLLPIFQINENQTCHIDDERKLKEKQDSDEQKTNKEGNGQAFDKNNELKQRESDHKHLTENKKYEKANEEQMKESDNPNKIKTDADENMYRHENNEMTDRVIEKSDDSQEVIFIDFQAPLELDVISISSEDSQENAQNLATKLQNLCEEDIKIQNFEDKYKEIDEKSDLTIKNVQLKDTIGDNKENICISDDDCGYHSSDFEFISEDEAKMDGLIIKYNAKNAKNAVNEPTQVKTIEITIDGIVSDGRNNSGANIHPCQNPGPSFPNLKNLRWYQRQPLVLDDSYRINHRTVDRENYHSLFKGNSNRITTRSMRSLENKSVSKRRGKKKRKKNPRDVPY